MKILAYIPATELREGDVYVCEGYLFQAEDVRHGCSYRYGERGFTPDTRTEWEAVWTGEGEDPGPWYRRYGSAGNALRTIALVSRETP